MQAPGPRGPVGPTGPKGPGLSPAYASFYTAGNQRILPGETLPLEYANPANSSGFILSGNAVAIAESGVYLVSHRVALAPGYSAVFVVRLFLIAANAAKVFRVNQSLALFIAGVYLSPTFVTMAAGDAAITPVSYTHLDVYKRQWLCRCNI